MTAFCLTETEWELEPEPPEYLKLYCALRRRMDYATGIAGLKRRLSEAYLRETLQTEACPKGASRQWAAA